MQSSGAVAKHLPRIFIQYKDRALSCFERSYPPLVAVKRRSEPPLTTDFALPDVSPWMADSARSGSYCPLLPLAIRSPTC